MGVEVAVVEVGAVAEGVGVAVAVAVAVAAAVEAVAVEEDPLPPQLQLRLLLQLRLPLLHQPQLMEAFLLLSSILFTKVVRPFSSATMAALFYHQWSDWVNTFQPHVLYHQ